MPFQLYLFADINNKIIYKHHIFKNIMKEREKSWANMGKHGQTQANMGKHGQSWANTVKHGETQANTGKPGQTWANKGKYRKHG